MDTTLVGFLALFAICFSGVPLGYSLIIVGTVGLGDFPGGPPPVGVFKTNCPGAPPAHTHGGAPIKE
ncbi:MAG: hypothetical protein OYG32_15320, partial [Rhodospirillaceae bacterium]|nr:hypothetical protein [Rhodospirillaceae bacterium]